MMPTADTLHGENAALEAFHAGSPAYEIDTPTVVLGQGEDLSPENNDSETSPSPKPLKKEFKVKDLVDQCSLGSMTSSSQAKSSRSKTESIEGVIENRPQRPHLLIQNFHEPRHKKILFNEHTQKYFIVRSKSFNSSTSGRNILGSRDHSGLHLKRDAGCCHNTMNCNLQNCWDRKIRLNSSESSRSHSGAKEIKVCREYKQ